MWTPRQGPPRSAPTFSGSGGPSGAGPYRAERGDPQRQRDHLPEGGETDSETDGEGWETDSGGHQSEEGFSDPDPEDPEE